jgi:hypothetical protein
MQLHNVGSAPQGQEELTRPSWSAQFNKETGDQVL